MWDGRLKPDGEWDELPASSDLRELFRYGKAGRVRIYNLRVVSNGTELWVVASTAGRVLSSTKKATFSNPDEMAVVLEDVERTLAVGGWRRLSGQCWIR